MAIKRTTPYRNYITPSKNIVLDVANDLGFDKTYSYELVRDIANYLSFPEDEREKAFTQPSSWEFEFDESTMSKVKIQTEIANRTEYHKNVQEFIRNLNYEAIGGDTPVEQAFNIIGALSTKNKGNCKGTIDGENAIPLFQPGNGASMSELAKVTEDTLELAEKIQPGSFTEKALRIDNSPLAGIRLAKLSPKQISILEKLSVFNSKGAIKAQKKVTRKECFDSERKRFMSMTSYGEVSKIAPINLALPDFDLKFAKMELGFNKPIEITEAKQILVLVIDDSSSMSTESKISWIKALFINRCEEVIKGNAELYICTFEVELDPYWIVIKDERDANAVWNKFSSYIALRRGGTNMQGALESVIKIIESGEIPTREGNVPLVGHRPQICIINDGQDNVEPGWIPRIVTHGFILDGSHEEMRKFCTRSGGIYEEFT